MSRWSLALLLVLCGCAVTFGPPRIPVPQELGDAPALRVTGLQGWMPGRRIGFGEYRMEGLQRPSPRLDEDETSRGTEYTAEQSIFFFLEEREERAARVDCRAEAWGRTAPGALRGTRMEWLTRSTESRSSLECGIALGESGEEWALTLERTSRDRFSGALEGSDTFDIRLVSPLPGTPTPEVMLPQGVLFVSGDSAVAAVELNAEGRVRLSPALSPDARRAIAGAAIAMLSCNGPPLNALRETCEPDW